MDGGGTRRVGVVGAVVGEELLGDLGGVGDEVHLVPDHGGLPKEGGLADDDGGDEPDHDELRDDPLPLDVLLLALLLQRVAVDVLAPRLVVTVVAPSLLPPRCRIQ